jgi:hypothetical protein
LLWCLPCLVEPSHWILWSIDRKELDECTTSSRRILGAYCDVCLASTSSSSVMLWPSWNHAIVAVWLPGILQID